jgi:aryl-alcohol dehydrogenase-like predicted oxidoreductase
MRTVPLGNTGVEVSAFCLGTMYLGSREDKATSYRLLDQYVEAGGSFLDTANTYARWMPGCAGGESETLLGAWMRERKNRSRLFVATKVGFAYPGVERGLRAHQIQTECEKSLQRLRTDTIDLCQAHVDDRNTPMEETLEAFDRLVRAGKVRFVGASNFAVWRLEEAHGSAGRTAGPCTAPSSNTTHICAPGPAQVSPPRSRPTATCWTTAVPGASRCWPIRHCWAALTRALTGLFLRSTSGQIATHAWQC